MTPKHSISNCPICSAGLCGVRICDGPSRVTASNGSRNPSTALGHRHGLIVCDECEAIWLIPDVHSRHLYPDPEHARCPVCHDPLWGASSHWANAQEIARLGWSASLDHELDHDTDEGVA